MRAIVSAVLLTSLFASIRFALPLNGKSSPPDEPEHVENTDLEEAGVVLFSEPTAKPGPFDQLFSNRVEWDKEAIPVRNDSVPEVPRHPELPTTDKIGRIYTKDRRQKRIPLMFPLIDDPDFIPSNHEAERAKVWDIVIGIPSIDTELCSKRREYQRNTWFRYASVGKTVLVKYVLARHPETGYAVSDVLRSEARKHNDIIFFELKEGKWDRNKGPKTWEVEVGMARKSYAWYCFVADTYKTSFVMKSDDDVFLRTELLRNELRSLPFTSKVYYGRIMYKRVRKGVRFPYSGGMSITMSYDLVDWVRDSRIAEITVDYEDLMVGKWFYLSHIRLNVVQDCRNHDIYSGLNRQEQTNASICVHHLKDAQDYTSSFQRYPDTSFPPPKQRSMDGARIDAAGNTFLDIGGSCKWRSPAGS